MTASIVRNGSPKIDTGRCVVVGAWSGNVRPYAAVAYLDGKRIGSTGFCRSEGRAIAAAERPFATLTAGV